MIRGMLLAVGVAVLLGGLLVKTLTVTQLICLEGLVLLVLLRSWAARRGTDKDAALGRLPPKGTDQ